MWQGWINLVLGVWLIISGLILSLQAPVNMIIVGILVAIFGLWVYKMWQGVANGILGVWIFLSGLFFNLAVTVNFIIVGIVIGILGLWSALKHLKKVAPKTT